MAAVRVIIAFGVEYYVKKSGVRVDDAGEECIVYENEHFAIWVHRDTKKIHRVGGPAFCSRDLRVKAWLKFGTLRNDRGPIFSFNNASATILPSPAEPPSVLLEPRAGTMSWGEESARLGIHSLWFNIAGPPPRAGRRVLLHGHDLETAAAASSSLSD